MIIDTHCHIYTSEMENADEDLRAMCEENARKLYGDPLPDLVAKRLERELGLSDDDEEEALQLEESASVQEPKDNAQENVIVESEEKIEQAKEETENAEDSEPTDEENIDSDDNK